MRRARSGARSWDRTAQNVISENVTTQLTIYSLQDPFYYIVETINLNVGSFYAIDDGYFGIRRIKKATGTGGLEVRRTKDSISMATL